jgi:hypothetical protein
MVSSRSFNFTSNQRHVILCGPQEIAGRVPVPRAVMNAASTHANCKDSWVIKFQLEFTTAWKLGSLKRHCLGSRNRDLLRVCLIYLAVYPAIYPFWLVIVAPKQIEKVMVTITILLDMCLSNYLVVPRGTLKPLTLRSVRGAVRRPPPLCQRFLGFEGLPFDNWWKFAVENHHWLFEDVFGLSVHSPFTIAMENRGFLSHGTPKHQGVQY